MSKILYRETAGAGEDEENRLDHGIAVTLTYWDSDDWQAPSHYLIQIKVMIDRKFVVDEIEIRRDSYSLNTEAKYIRQAIARFDQLVELNPEVAE